MGSQASHALGRPGRETEAVSCGDLGWCADCGDCLSCYGDELCAITEISHGAQIPDDEPVATPNPEGVGDTPE